MELFGSTASAGQTYLVAGFADGIARDHEFRFEG